MLLWLRLTMLAAIVLAVDPAPVRPAVAPTAQTRVAPADHDPDPDSYEPGVLHVKFRLGVAPSPFQARVTHELSPGLGWWAIAVPPGSEAPTLRELRADPGVVAAAPNYRVQLAAPFPTDPGYFIVDRGLDPKVPEDVRLQEADYFEQQWNLKVPQVPEAWDLAIGTPSMVIAVIDSGVFLRNQNRATPHDDLEGRLLPGANFVPLEEGTKNENDNLGHGTAVTGLLVANVNNGKQLAGIN
jgi:hypothetical protein